MWWGVDSDELDLGTWHDELEVEWIWGRFAKILHWNDSCQQQRREHVWSLSANLWLTHNLNGLTESVNTHRPSWSRSGQKLLSPTENAAPESVVLPLIQWLCEIKLCHRVTGFFWFFLHNSCPAAWLALRSVFSTTALLLIVTLVQACVSGPIRTDLCIGDGGGLKDRVFQTVGEYSAASLDKIRTLICYLSAMASSSNPK